MAYCSDTMVQPVFALLPNADRTRQIRQMLPGPSCVSCYIVISIEFSLFSFLLDSVSGCKAHVDERTIT